MKQFVIGLTSLSIKEHNFEFKIENSFFKNFENSPVETGELDVTVVLDIQERLILCTFIIKGTVELTCDRSLEEFDYPINKTDKIIFRYADSYEELSEDLINIPQGQIELDLAPFIYELIAVAIPMKRLHPKYEDELSEEDDEETVEFVYSSEEEKTEDDKKDDDDIDPRWKDLLNLKNN